MRILVMALSIALSNTLLGCLGEIETNSSHSSIREGEDLDVPFVQTQRPPAIVKEGAVGVFALVDSKNSESVKFKTIIPKEFVTGDISPDSDTSTTYTEWSYPVRIEHRLHLYDSESLLGELSAPSKAEGRFWCENDGRAQYRPDFTVEVKKDLLRRAPKPLEKFPDIGAMFLSEETMPPECLPIVLVKMSISPHSMYPKLEIAKSPMLAYWSLMIERR